MNLEMMREMANEAKDIASKREQTLVAAEGLIGELDEAIATPLNIVVIGEFSSGKSSIINAIIGRDVLPTNLPETTQTTFLVEVVSPEREGLLVKGEALPLSEISKVNLPEKQVVEVRVASENLPVGTRILDTPGLSSIYAVHERITAEALQKADAILLVAPAKQGVTESLKGFLTSSKFYAPKILLLLSQADLLSEGERKEVLDAAKSLAGDLGIQGVVMVSAKGEPGVGELLAALRESVLKRAGEIKAESIRRRLLGLIEHQLKTLRELLGSLRLDVGEIEEKIREHSRRRREIITEIKRKTAELKDELYSAFKESLSNLERRLNNLAKDDAIVRRVIDMESPYPFIESARLIWEEEQANLSNRVEAILGEYKKGLKSTLEVELNLPGWLHWFDVIIALIVAVLGPLGGWLNVLEGIIGKKIAEWLRKKLAVGTVRSALFNAVQKAIRDAKEKSREILNTMEAEVEKKVRDELAPQLEDIERALEELKRKKEEEKFNYETERKEIETDIKRLERLRERLVEI